MSKGAVLDPPGPVQGKSSGSTIRISLDVTPQMKTIIDDLAGRSGVPQAMLLRQAIALYKAIKDAEDKGEAAALVDGNGKVTARLVGL